MIAKIKNNKHLTMLTHLRKMMLAFCCIGFLLPLWGLAQTESSVPLATFELSLQSKGMLAFDLDVCQLQGNNGTTALELQYALDLRQLVNKTSKMDSVRFHVKIKFLDMQSQLIHASESLKSVAIDTTKDSRENLTFVDLNRFSISADTLQLFVNISDADNKKQGRINTALVVKSLPESRLSISDPVFLSHVQRASEPNAFVRQGFLMIPNPNRIYRTDGTHTDLTIYQEINGLTFDVENPSVYSLNYTISDLTGKEVKNLKHQTLPVTRSNISRLDKLSLADLQTGVYRLKVQVIDIASNTGASLQKYFRVVTGQESEGMLLPMGKADIQKYAKQIQYLASSEEKALFHSLDSHGKQAFLLQFWRSRDTTPETPENEFMMEYFKRIAYCDAHFTNGISSDQGRIYLKYGEPMEIQRFKASTQYTKPVEIWIYAVEGTSEFVFVDRIGGDQFTLMHSSHPDEYHNPDWAETLQ